MPTSHTGHQFGRPRVSSQALGITINNKGFSSRKFQPLPAPTHPQESWSEPPRLMDVWEFEYKAHKLLTKTLPTPTMTVDSSITAPREPRQQYGTKNATPARQKAKRPRPQPYRGAVESGEVANGGVSRQAIAVVAERRIGEILHAAIRDRGWYSIWQKRG